MATEPATVTTTAVPSGTVFPAAEVTPWRFTVPTAIAVVVNTDPELLSGTTATEACFVSPAAATTPASEYVATTLPPATVNWLKLALPGVVPAEEIVPPALWTLQQPLLVIATLDAAVSPTNAPSGTEVTPSLSFNPLMVITAWLTLPFAVRSTGDALTLALPGASN